MLSLYTFAFVLGGILLLASAFMGGHDDVDGELSADSDVEAPDADVEAELDNDLAHGSADLHGDVAGFFTAFVSLRFWTFFTTFFGLSGLAISLTEVVDREWMVTFVSAGVGLAVAYAAVLTIRSLSRTQLGTVPDPDAYVGKVGRVLLPIAQSTSQENSFGKLRIELGGTTVDLLATTEDEKGFSPGEQALIVQMNETVALVSHFKPEDNQRS